MMSSSWYSRYRAMQLAPRRKRISSQAESSAESPQRTLVGQNEHGTHHGSLETQVSRQEIDVQHSEVNGLTNAPVGPLSSNPWGEYTNGFEQHKKLLSERKQQQEQNEKIWSKLHQEMDLRKRLELANQSRQAQRPEVARILGHHGVYSVVKIKPLLETMRQPPTITKQDNHCAVYHSASGLPQIRHVSRVLGPETTTADLVEDLQWAADAVVGGFDVLIAAAGSTGSGKTYTMFGQGGSGDGLVALLLQEILNQVDLQHDAGWRFKIGCRAWEVLDDVTDLLCLKSSAAVELSSIGGEGIFDPRVDCEERIIDTMDDFQDVIDTVVEKRKNTRTAKNTQSSRSHLLVGLKLEGRRESVHKIETVSPVILFMDLGGYEAKIMATNETIEASLAEKAQKSQTPQYKLSPMIGEAQETHEAERQAINSDLLQLRNVLCRRPLEQASKQSLLLKLLGKRRLQKPLTIWITLVPPDATGFDANVLETAEMITNFRHRASATYKIKAIPPEVTQ